MVKEVRNIKEKLNERGEPKVSKETERKMRIIANRIIEKILETDMTEFQLGRNSSTKTNE